jgi:hypothetical protein
MSKKEKKNFAIPPWIVEILDYEAEKAGGPGIVVAASILYFNTRNPKEKADIIKEYRSREISLAYQDDTAAQAVSDKQKHKKDQPSSSKYG